jgi:hypothetical protein
MSLESPEAVCRAARKGLLVGFVTEPLESLPPWPVALWFTTDRDFLPGAVLFCTAADLEDGTARQAPPGAVVEARGRDPWGTSRHPTRLRDWYQEILRHRLVVFLGERPEGVPPGGVHWQGSPAKALEGRARPAPPLPGVVSRAGWSGMALAATVVVASWITLYARLSGAQNWMWLALVPWGLAAGLFAVLLAPLVSRTGAGVDLPAREWYLRTAARWSRWWRAPVALAVLLALGLWPCWLMARHARATFVILYEPGVVSVEGGATLGACRADGPCTLIVPRGSHLHFEGGDGGVCGLDFDRSGGVLFIDTQQDGCEPFLPDEPAPTPRG